MDNQTAKQKRTTVQPVHTLEHVGIPTEQARALATFIGVEVHHAVDQAVPPAVDKAVAKAVPPAVEEAVAKAVPLAVDAAVAKAVQPAVDKAVARAVQPAVEGAMDKASDKIIDQAVDKMMDKAKEVFVTKYEFEAKIQTLATREELAEVRANMVTKDEFMQFHTAMIDRMNEFNLAIQAQIDKKFDQINKKFDHLKVWMPTMVIVLVGAFSSLMALWLKVS